MARSATSVLKITNVEVLEKLIRRSMPELDTVRGIAILLVVLFHGFVRFGIAGLSGPPRFFVLATRAGWMGVNLFFVLSGFLITGILLDSRETPHYFRNFYIRRALRILPAYYLLLLVLLIVPQIGIHRAVSLEFIGLSFVYLSNVTALFGVPMQYRPLWSLAVEEHFYLLWPTVVRFVSQRGLSYLATAIFFGCPLLRALAFRWNYPYEEHYTWFVADGLAAGAILALRCREPGTERKTIKRFSLFCVSSAVLLILLGAPFGILRSNRLMGASLRVTVLNLFFTGVLGAILLIGTSRWRWLVRRPILQFFGEISYGLYLFHMLVFDLLNRAAFHYFPRYSASLMRGHFGMMFIHFTIAAAVAVAVAFLSRYTIEATFLGLKSRWTAPVGDRVPIQAAFSASRSE